MTFELYSVQGSIQNFRSKAYRDRSSDQDRQNAEFAVDFHQNNLLLKLMSSTNLVYRPSYAISYNVRILV